MRRRDDVDIYDTELNVDDLDVNVIIPNPNTLQFLPKPWEPRVSSPRENLKFDADVAFGLVMKEPSELTAQAFFIRVSQRNEVAGWWVSLVNIASQEIELHIRYFVEMLTNIGMLSMILCYQQ